jgi:hypothetical protein
MIVSQNILLAGTLWLCKGTTDPHILRDLHIVCSDDRYPKLKICISQLVLGSYESIPAKYVTVYCMMVTYLK